MSVLNYIITIQQNLKILNTQSLYINYTSLNYIIIFFKIILIILLFLIGNDKDCFVALFALLCYINRSTKYYRLKIRIRKVI